MAKLILSKVDERCHIGGLRHVEGTVAGGAALACDEEPVSTSGRSARRAPSTTFAPRSENSRALASPMPLLAPVIGIVFPAMFDMSNSLGWIVACVGMTELRIGLEHQSPWPA